MSDDARNMNGQVPFEDGVVGNGELPGSSSTTDLIHSSANQFGVDNPAFAKDEIQTEEFTNDGGSSTGPIPTISFSVERQVYSQEDFDKDFDGAEGRPSKTIKEKCQYCRSKCECTSRCVRKHTLSYLPFIGIMRKYSIKEDLLFDCIAGLTISVLYIPQGMAYALLANVDPVYGLYTCFFGVLLYFFFGTSRHISVGVFAIVSLMIGTAVDKQCPTEGSSDGDTPDVGTTFSPTATPGYTDTNGSTLLPGGGGGSERDCSILAATAVTFMAGAIQLALGLTRLGIVVIYLSEPLTRGFTTGAAIHVFTSQLKYVFGLSIPSYNGAWKLIYTYRDLFKALPDTNFCALIVSAVSMIFLWCMKEYINPRVKKYTRGVPVPSELIVVIAAVIGSYFGKWDEKYDLPIVGEIPTGLPAPVFPPTSYMTDLIGDAVAVAIVAFAVSVSMAQLFADKHNYKVDANQELVAHGVCNLVACNFSCFTTSASLSRSVVLESLGTRTQLSGIFAAGVLLLVLLWLAPLFEYLPNCALGAIVLVALKGMFMQFTDLKRLWIISKVDLSVWLVAFIGVVLFDVAWGLMIGVGYALLTVVGTTQFPYTCLEGRIPDTDIYKDIKVYSAAEEIPGVKVFRFESPLYFANSRHFQQRLYRKTGCNPKKLKILQAKVDKKLDMAVYQKTKYDEKLAISVEKGKPPPKMIVLEFTEEMSRSERPDPNSHHIVLDFGTITRVDSQGVTYLGSVLKDYKAIDVKVFLAGCKAGVREMLERSGFYEKWDRDILFPTVHDAVLAAVQDYPELQEKLKVTKVTTTSQTPQVDDSDSEFDSDKDDSKEANDDFDLSEKIVIGSQSYPQVSDHDLKQRHFTKL